VIRFDEGLVVDLSRKLDLLEIIFECHGSHQFWVAVGWNNAEFVNEGRRFVEQSAEERLGATLVKFERTGEATLAVLA
jgi:hypothetical protein